MTNIDLRLTRQEVGQLEKVERLGPVWFKETEFGREIMPCLVDRGLVLREDHVPPGELFLWTITDLGVEALRRFYCPHAPVNVPHCDCGDHEYGDEQD